MTPRLNNILSQMQHVSPIRYTQARTQLEELGRAPQKRIEDIIHTAIVTTGYGKPSGWHGWAQMWLLVQLTDLLSINGSTDQSFVGSITNNLLIQKHLHQLKGLSTETLQAEINTH